MLVLEARDRVGGRIWTRRFPGLSVPIELGAEFIHGEAGVTRRLLRRARLRAIDGGHEQEVFIDRGRWKPVDAFAEAQRAMRNASALKGKDTSFAAFLSRQRLPRLTRVLAKMMVEGFDAADPKRVSARSIAEEWGEGGSLGDSQPRPQGGYGALLDWLTDSLVAGGARLKLGALVQSVRRTRGSAIVEGRFLGDPFRARARSVIVTLPLGVLQCGPVRFPEKAQALEGLASGPVVKAALRFHTPFWEARHPDVQFFHAPEGAFPTFWTRGSVLIAWAGGPKAVRLAGKNLIAQAMRSLESMFPGSAKHLDAACVHDWAQDPFARGAYSYVLVGGDGAREALARPIAGSVFFAGEATDAEEAGTVAGALRSGLRAAQEVLEA